MLFSYPECVKKYGSAYQIKKNCQKKTLFEVETGIYSDSSHVSELEVISKKYPNAVFTLDSAFYYHGLTDTIPEQYHLATKRGKSKIKDKRIKQTFENSNKLSLGVIKMQYNNATISVYNKERLLVELIRYKSKIPFDRYKEIIRNYRNQIDSMDIPLILDYAYELPKSNMVIDTIRKEVL